MVMDPDYETIHRAGLSSDYWLRLRAVLDSWGATASSIGSNGGAIAINPAPPVPGQSLVTDDANNVSWSYPVISSNTLIETPPVAAVDAWSDEFLSGSPILTDRGWTIVNAQSGGVITRTGEVDFTITPTTETANTYRSSIRNGKLLLQICGSSLALIYKASAGSYTYTLNAVNSLMEGSNLLGLYAAANLTSFVPGNTNSLIYNRYAGGTAQHANVDNGVTTSYFNAALVQQATSGASFLLSYNSSTQNTRMYTLQANGSTVLASTNNQVVPMTNGSVNYVGFVVQQLSSKPMSFATINCMRRAPLLTFYPL